MIPCTRCAGFVPFKKPSYERRQIGDKRLESGCLVSPDPKWDTVLLNLYPSYFSQPAAIFAASSSCVPFYLLMRRPDNYPTHQIPEAIFVRKTGG